jgi:hypothetical protein
MRVCTRLPVLNYLHQRQHVPARALGATGSILLGSPTGVREKYGLPAVSVSFVWEPESALDAIA